MINIHSVSFKFSGLILFASLLFLLTLTLLTTQLTIKQYENIEQGKLEAISDNISDTLSLNISYGFDKAIKEMADTLYQNPHILYVCIQDLKHDIIRHSRDKQSFESYQNLQHFSLSKPLYDPLSKALIGNIELIYSRTPFETMMLEYYQQLSIIIVIFLFLISLLTLFLYRSISPLGKLAQEMSTFDPKNPKAFTFNTHDKSEIGLISRASNTMLASINDYLHKLKSLQEAVIQRELHLRDAQRIAHVGSWEYWINNDQFEMSHELLRIFGINAKNYQSSWNHFLDFIIQDDRQSVENTFIQAIEEGSQFNIKYRCMKDNAEIIHIHTQGKVRKKSDGSIKMTGVSMDISKQHRSQEIIEKLAYYDPLTELPNRALFKDHLQKAIALSKRHKEKIAVLFIDLDRFKLINDSLGHLVGDELLKAVSKILVENLREEDTVSRLGGDEFTILLTSIKDEKDIEIIANNLLSSINKRLKIGRHELYISLSMGIAYYPNHGSTSDELIKHADTAMYKAKELGRNNFQFYQTQMGNHLNQQLGLEQDFRQAVTTQDSALQLYYQPKIDFKTLRITGAEALIRWEHPKHGLLFPDSFIPLAESTGLILDLGTWIIEKGIQQVLLWEQTFAQPLQISINLSARQFQDSNLVPLIASLIEKYQVNPSLLEFEITESISMSNIADNLLIMGELKSLGVALAIDDFGTGYSSLSYLKQFPVDTLKIDKSFVMDMLKDKDDKVIVSTIISMAEALGLKTVAEGVETHEHEKTLQEMGCDIAQGYHYAKALEAKAFLEFALGELRARA
ncbi:MAG: EAL domain-containing protein [Campylobacterota bacterium]|nr:EAL domain-containing protein [Campylobacterota bacterium]